MSNDLHDVLTEAIKAVTFDESLLGTVLSHAHAEIFPRTFVMNSWKDFDSILQEAYGVDQVGLAMAFTLKVMDDLEQELKDKASEFLSSMTERLKDSIWDAGAKFELQVDVADVHSS